MRFVWYIPSFLQAFLLWILARGRTFRTFPLFFAYTVFGVLAGAARFAALNRRVAYFWTYWGTDAIYIILGTLSLFEVSRIVLGNLTRAWWKHLFFPAIVAASILLSISRFQAVPPKLETRFAWIITGEIAVRFAQVLMFAGLVTLVFIVRLWWGRRERGIAAGFGVYGTVMLWATAQLSDSGRAIIWRWSAISIGAYCLALLIWIWSFRAKRESEITMPRIDRGDRPFPLDPGAPSPGKHSGAGEVENEIHFQKDQICSLRRVGAN